MSTIPLTSPRIRLPSVTTITCTSKTIQRHNQKSVQIISNVQTPNFTVMRPVINHGRELSAIRNREEHSTSAIETISELLADCTNSRSVDQWSDFLDLNKRGRERERNNKRENLEQNKTTTTAAHIINQDAMIQSLISVMHFLQIKILRHIIG
jgi:hypothetical protein